MTLNNSFEGISNGVAVTVGNSGGVSGDAFSTVSGSIVASNSAAFVGSRGIVATLSSSTQSYVAWDVSGSSHYVRGYFQIPVSGPTHNMRLIYGHTGTTKNWEIRVNIPAVNIDLLIGGTQRVNLGSDGGTGAFTSGAWYRIEGYISNSASEIRVYNAAGSLLDSGSWTGTATPGTQIRYGLHNGSATSSTISADGFGYDSVTWLGEYPVSQSPQVELRNSFDGISDTNAVTTSNSGGSSGDAFSNVAGSVVAMTNASFTGARGLRSTLSASTESYVSWNVGGTEHYSRAYFKTASSATTHNARFIWSGTAASTTTGWDVRQIVSSELLGFATRNTTRLTLGVNGSGAGALSRDTWYRVELRVATGPSGTVEMRLYNTSGVLLDSNTWNGPIDQASEIRYGLGNGANINSTNSLDAIGYSNQYWVGPTDTSNIPPSISINASHSTVRSFETVTLSTVASNPDGAPPTITFEQIAGVPVVLSGSGSSRTFQAPATQGGTSMTFYAIASDGVDEVNDSVTITVYPHREYVRQSGVWVQRRVRSRRSGVWI